MRRSEKKIKDLMQIDSIIRAAKVCRLALSDNGQPYIVPMCFGYKADSLYFHSAPEGKKIEIIRANPKVCFEFDYCNGIKDGEKVCNWGMFYQSVIGFGKAVFVNRLDEKIEALAEIVKQYTNRSFQLPENIPNNIIVFKIEIDHISGKQSV